MKKNIHTHTYIYAYIYIYIYLNHFAITRNSYKIVKQLYFNLKKKIVVRMPQKKKDLKQIRTET